LTESTAAPRATLIGLFRRAAQSMVEELVQRLAAAGYGDLPAAYHPVFENIDQGGTRLTVLAARAGMTHQSMGELVSTLELRGYVERVPDPADGRARLVRLTAEGRRMVRTALVEIAAIERDWLVRLSDVDGPASLRDALERAVVRSGSAPAPRGTPAGGREGSARTSGS